MKFVSFLYSIIKSMKVQYNLFPLKTGFLNCIFYLKTVCLKKSVCYWRVWTGEERCFAWSLLWCLWRFSPCWIHTPDPTPKLRMCSVSHCVKNSPVSLFLDSKRGLSRCQKPPPSSPP